MNEFQFFVSTEIEKFIQSKKLSIQNFLTLVLSYDNILFGNQIQNKLREMGYTLKIEYDDKDVCLVEKRNEKEIVVSNPKKAKEIVIVLNTQLIKEGVKFEKKNLSKILHNIDKAKTRSDLITLYFEHNLIHLLVELWGYQDPNNDIHGKLFDCMYNFLSDRQKPKVKTQGLFRNFSNSCYLDSLLMILLFSKPDFYRREILTKEVQQPSEKLCSTKSKISTKAEELAFAREVQKQFREDFKSLRKGGIGMCSKIRSLLTKCLPEMGMDSYNSSEIYSLISDIFPSIKIPPVKVGYYKNRKLDNVFNSPSQALFQMWDYMEPPPEDGPRVVWDNLIREGPEVIVFQNGMSPPIEHFNSTEPEKVRVWDEKLQKPVFKLQTKSKKFSEYIIGKKYRLFAIVYIIGGKPTIEGHWGGGHYTSMFRWYGNGEWYNYDDMSPSWKKIPDFTDDYLDSGRGIFPELFFYERI